MKRKDFCMITIRVIKSDGGNYTYTTNMTYVGNERGYIRWKVVFSKACEEAGVSQHDAGVLFYYVEEGPEPKGETDAVEDNR
jgi:hypothetical protein